MITGRAIAIFESAGAMAKIAEASWMLLSTRAWGSAVDPHQVIDRARPTVSDRRHRAYGATFWARVRPC